MLWKKSPTLILLLLPLVAFGQDADQDIAPAAQSDEPVEIQPLDEETTSRFLQAAEGIREARQNIDVLDDRIDESEGVIAQILTRRRDRVWTDMVESTLRLAGDVADERDDNRDVSAFIDTVIDDLNALPDDSIETMTRISARVVFPDETLDQREFVVADQRLFRVLLNQDDVYRSMVAYIDVAARFDIDTTETLAELASRLSESAANRSVFLELAANDVGELRAASETLPDDQDISAWLAVAESRVRGSARALEDILDLLDAVGIRSRTYRQQVLTATGEITTDVLDVGLVASLVAQWTAQLTDFTRAQGPKVVLRLLLFIFIVYVSYKLAGLVRKGVERALAPMQYRMSRLLRTMILSSVRNITLFIGILIALSQIGISLTPVLTGLGIAGFIVGFALQDSLSNFASGMMILIYRPFDVGDYVEAGGVKGKVSRMSLVNTTFMTFDNQKLVVPNNKIWQSVIINFTDQMTRRVDLMFGISYGDDIEKAERILNEVLANYDAILDDPPPMIKVHELADSSVNIIVRPWVKTEDYWDTYWDLTREVKLAFDREGITIPFPQRTVHTVGGAPE